MTVYRVSFLIDAGRIYPGLDAEAVSEAVVSDLLAAARARARAKFREAKDDAVSDEDVKTIKMGEALRAILLTLAAEANLSFEEMPEGTKVETELPFEKRYEPA